MWGKLGTAVTTIVALLLGMVLTADAASIRVRCEKRSNRSKISVDGFDLNGQFTAKVTSGSQTRTSAPKNAVLGEDFDSDAGDIAAGATQIGANFITTAGSPDVKGEILSSAGASLTPPLQQSVDCKQK